MSNVIACYKWVMDEAAIQFNPDLSLDVSGISYKVSDYDRNAIQLAVEFAKASGDVPVGLTCGDGNSSKSFNNVLARDLSEAYLADITSIGGVDSVVTAQALAAAVRKIGDCKWVICADASSDVYGQQTGARIAALLDLPYVGLICEAHLEGDTLHAVRKLNGEYENVCVKAPAVISILPETIEPMIPGLRALLAAKKKPSHVLTAEELELSVKPETETVDQKAFVMVRKNQMLEGENMQEKAQALVNELRKEGVL